MANYKRNCQLSYCIAVLLVSLHSTLAMPSHTADEILVEEIERFSATNAGDNNATATLITLSETSDESASAEETMADNSQWLGGSAAPADDLIFLAKRPKNQAKSSEEKNLHWLSSDEDSSSLTAHSRSDSESNGEEAPDEIELQPSVTPEVPKPIDMSDFLALIPAAEVQSIVANYYQHDAEVKRAYSFLSSRHFTEIRQHIVQMPEIKAFLRYLNSSGLDVLGFLATITNQTRKPITIEEQQQQQQQKNEPTAANEIEKHFQEATSAPTLNPNEPFTQSTTTPTKEQLNGLHGLVDSILDVLPQDQILTTFFDKLETDEQFSKLVDSIGTPTFAKILSNMQSSAALRNLIFTLHNNGIYITRIVDSLKSYFFLGTL